MAGSLPDRLLRAMVGSCYLEITHRSASEAQNRYLKSHLAEGALTLRNVIGLTMAVNGRVALKFCTIGMLLYAPRPISDDPGHK